jgi:F-type H+-transporting ATPase subunit delta
LAIGKEDGQAEKYKEELGAFVTLLDEQKELEQAISNPLYDDESRKKVLQAVVQRSGLSQVMVYDFYEKLTDELANIVRADLVSATDLPEDTIDRIRAALAQKTGKEVKMDVTVDPDLVGGAVTKIGDLVLDGSVRTQLKTLKESLQRSEVI